jgi:Protein of unknown function (DUF3810)
MRRLGLPLAAAVLAWTPLPPASVERVYATIWYPRVQPVLTGASNTMTFAWLDPLAVLTVAVVVAALIRTWRGAAGGVLRRSVEVLLLIAQVAAALYLVFLLAWGFNYRRPPPAERLEVSQDRVTPERLERLGRASLERVNELYDPGRSLTRLGGEPLIADLAPSFAAAERALGSGWHAAPGRPKESIVAYVFPLAGVDGMINPFGLEVILNPEVLPFERPFVLAHEWAHLAGHAPESEASFVAFLTCLRGSRDAQYSGWLDLLLHALRAVPLASRQALLANLAEGPRVDLRAIQARLRRAQPVVHRVSWRVYDQYLRANRVDSGVRNYDEVVTLVLGSRFTEGVIERDE